MLRPHNFISITASLLILLTASAVNAQGPTAVTVNTLADTPDANPGDGICADSSGLCSLRAAIQEANAQGTSYLITLAQGATYALTIPGSGEDQSATGDLDVSGPLTIDGRGATIDCGGIDRGIDVQSGATLILQATNITNGSVTGESGGALRNTGNCIIADCRLTNSSAQGAGASGGCVFNDNGGMMLERSALNGGSADRAGGALEANGGITLMQWCEMGNNQTGPVPGNGGALHLTGAGMVQATLCWVHDNVAAREGGGLWNSAAGTMMLKLCWIVDNAANGPAAHDGGGGLFNDGGLMEVDECFLLRNRAQTGSGSGGGILNLDGDLTVDHSLIQDNLANRAGGGIEASSGTTLVTDCIFQTNSTGPMPGNGGGLHLTGPGIVDVLFSRMTSNVASAEGGALWNSSTGTMNVLYTLINNNLASGDLADQGGGGLFNDGGILSIENTDVLNNNANGVLGSGGGILNAGGSLDVFRCTIGGNRSQRAGGGIEDNSGFTTIARSTVSFNQTGAMPGNGGGLHVTGPGQVNMDLSYVFGNGAADEGGGLWNSTTGSITATQTLVFLNNAPVKPNTFNDGGTFTLNGVAIAVGP